MKKILTAAMALMIGGAFCFAGDAAVFSDIGFSEDGLTYIFGQYGKTDGDYEAWAEIYTVDVAKNDYVPGQVYKVSFPDSTASSISGKKAYETLLERTEWKLAAYECTPASLLNYIYVSEDESKNPVEEIVFRDFDYPDSDGAVFHHIRLVPTYVGSGKNVRSKFYIDYSVLDQDGKVLRHEKVGTPDFMRDGISKYRIAKVFTDDNHKSLIFVVEKTLIDDTGTSIRYMVEALRL